MDKRSKRYHDKYLKKILSRKYTVKKRKLKHFKLPFEPYGGLNTTERIIEIPWALTNAIGSSVVLEVGFARGEKEWIESLLASRFQELHGIDTYDYSMWRFPEVMKNIRTIIADVRESLYNDNFFDCILCISTIEHIGMDYATIKNPRGSPPRKVSPEWFNQHIADFQTMSELTRILNKGGRILLSVPFGKLANYGSSIHYNWERLFAICTSSGLLIESTDFFRFNRIGWFNSTKEELKDVLYQTDDARGAAGLACVILRKK